MSYSEYEKSFRRKRVVKIMTIILIFLAYLVLKFTDMNNNFWILVYSVLIGLGTERLIDAFKKKK